jgi:predicted O-linked N-acetylglucosamine transferase (SPINDLY family)
VSTRPPGVEQRLERAREHLRAQRHGAARDALLLLARQHPGDAEVHRLLGEACEALRQFGMSLHYATLAREAAPDDPACAVQYARSLAASGRVDEAAASLRAFLGRFPLRREVRGELVMMLLSMDRLDEATRLCEEGVALDPEADSIRAAHAMVLRKRGRLGEARAILRDLQWRRPRDVFPVEYLAVLLLYDPEATPEGVFAMHRRYGQLVRDYAADVTFAFPATDDPGRRLRVGLLSPDLYTHSVAYFAEPILDGLDRGAFEVVCYHTGTTSDEVTRRLAGKAGVFRHLPMAESVGLARRIHEDRIDILIELTGLYSGHRMHTMALRPAPVQMTYIGYPCTTGVAGIDVRIVDSRTDPPGAEALATERLVRLDPCFLCYRPPEGAPTPRRETGARGGGVTFGSFNSALKVNDRVVRAWARVLAETPGSRLLFKGLGLSEALVRDEFFARFREAGVEPGRLEIVAQTAHWKEHLAMYDRVDVALDTFPYNGTTTTCEALLMGVPVVTLAGAAHAGRVGVSLLGAVGLDELVGRDEDEYVRIAAELAQDHARRAALHAALPGRLRASALCDVAGFGARLGALLREAWAARCAGKSTPPGLSAGR